MLPLQPTSPVRMQVDVAAPPGFAGSSGGSWIDGPDWEEAVAALLESRLFFLQIGYPGTSPVRRKRFGDLAARAVAAGIRVSVALAGDEEEPGELIPPGVAEAFTDVSLRAGDPDLRDLLAAFVEAIGRGKAKPRAGALFMPRRGDLALVPKVMAAAGGAGLDLLELPPPPLVYCGGGEAAGFVPGAAEYRELASRPLPREQAGTVADLRVHDVLLWAVLARRGAAPAGEGEGFGGCQAASALAYVRSDGTVFPCASLGVALGHVTGIAGAGFWDGGEAAGVRRAVARAAGTCRGCAALRLCRGGCPGTRLASTGSWQPRDPLCGVFGELAERDDR